ncbi:acyl-CoA thioesterase [Mycetocola tolaasinivorans]|uniref:Acyl-CoA thioesterase n=1 Tax=Mycetocola tolaasinivorans TaxID=76635 RepID=A0A3L7A4V2_9MICO|nr:thioesterase family protein [Mycetocola tolaasinivorans]RLP74968.1 acyl-CoA thioesterase [Mycetocola tolaasinivorans]
MKIDVPLSLRWADLDAYNHVNNVEFFRLLEEARVRVFWTRQPGESDLPDELAVISAEAGSGIMTLIGSQRIEYLAPLEYRQKPIVIRLWIARLGGASMEVHYEVRDGSAPEDRVYAIASTTMVLVDAASGRPMRVPSEQREAWTPLLEEPVSFRDR